MKAALRPKVVSPNRIVFATDFSPMSRAAFLLAKQLSHKLAAHLLIVNVFEYANVVPPEGGGDLLEIESFYHDAERSLDALLTEAREDGLNVAGALLGGIANDAILKCVEEDFTDLVVLATGAAHGFERLVFGSTAEAVIRKARCAVVTVGPRAVERPVPFADREGIVLFATDFHTSTLDSLHQAAFFAALTGSPLHCLHVLPRDLQSQSAKSVIPTMITEALARIAKGALLGMPAPVCTVAYGVEVSTAIANYAREHRAKLIVLGVKRAAMAVSHMPAQVAYRLIAEAPCPVLTVAYPLPAENTEGLLTAQPCRVDAGVPMC